MIPQPPRRTGFFEHYEELIGTWTRRLRNRQQAEDLAHDTFVRVLESTSSEVEQPRAYLHQTARNIAVDAYRREDRREAITLEAFDQCSPHSGDPEHFMHAIQLADSIERAWPICVASRRVSAHASSSTTVFTRTSVKP